MRFVLPLRYVLPLALGSIATFVAAPALAAEEDRYGGGDASTYDFGGFDKLPSSSSAAGGYRSPTPPTTGPPASTSQPSPNQSAPRPTQPSSQAGFPSSNDLRQPSSGQLPSNSATLPPRNTGIVPSNQSQATLPGSSRPLSASQPTSSQPSANFPSSSSLNSSATQSAPRPSDPYANMPPSPSAGFGGSNPATRPSESGLRPSNNFSSPAGSNQAGSSQAGSYQSSPPNPGGDFRSNPQATAGAQNSFQQPNRTTATQPTTSQPMTSQPRQQFTDSSVLNSRVGVASDPAATLREQNTRNMLQKMLAPRQGSQLSGAPMSLASVVASAADRDEQSRRVEAYWALSSAATDYYLSLDEIGEMSRLRQTLPTYSTALGDVETALRTRLDTSLKAAKAAQYRLAMLMGGGVTPLPSDVPFTGSYATRIESVFPEGAPAEARLIAELLPLRLAQLQGAASDIGDSEKWVKKVADDQQSGSDGRGVVQALKFNALSRRAFVQLARDYNLQINRYSQLAAPDQIDTGRLVAMLIRTAPTGAGSADDAMIAGFSAGSNNSASRPPATSAPARR